MVTALFNVKSPEHEIAALIVYVAAKLLVVLNETDPVPNEIAPLIVIPLVPVFKYRFPFNVEIALEIVRLPPVA